MMTKVLILLFVLTSSAFADEGTNWSYSNPVGPSQWGSMAGFAACGTGSSQSPIAIESGEVADFKNISFDESLRSLVMDWKATATKGFNNGHTIEVPYDIGATTNFQGETYPLRQFHFHSPSEHSLNEQFYPLEIHFVHKTAAGKTLVVGVFVEEGEFNTELDAALGDKMVSTVSALDLLPRDNNYFHYMGSLTTPPCSEQVTWIVMKEPIEASKAQLNILQKINGGPNNRPLQSLNKRIIGTMEI
jgi:carbonic anhydrase